MPLCLSLPFKVCMRTTVAFRWREKTHKTSSRARVCLLWATVETWRCNMVDFVKSTRFFSRYKGLYGYFQQKCWCHWENSLINWRRPQDDLKPPKKLVSDPLQKSQQKEVKVYKKWFGELSKVKCLVTQTCPMFTHISQFPTGVDKHASDLNSDTNKL